MDLRPEIDRAAAEMEWGELASTLEAAIYDLLAEAPTTPAPTTSPPAPVPAELTLNAGPQPPAEQDGAHGGYFPLGADPNVGGTYEMFSRQGQYLPYQWPVDDIVTAAAVGDPATPPYLYGDLPVFTLHGDVEQNLHPVRVLNEDVVHEMPAEFLLAPPDSVVPPVDTSNSKKRKRRSQQDDDGSYIKKPPNAFMLYMREQRPNVEADIKNRGNAAVNVVLGQRWKALTKEEQAKYYEHAAEERLLHAQRHPGWSSKDNYGKKRKRGSRRVAPTRAEASSSAPEDDVQQAKRLRMTPTQPHPAPPHSWILQEQQSQAPNDWMPEEGFRELLEELELLPQTTQPRLPSFSHFN